MNLMIASNQWASRPEDERFQTLDALFEHCASRRGISREPIKDIRTLRAEVVDDRLMLGNGSNMVPSNWSFGQFCRELSCPPSFLQTLKPQTTATILNERIDLFGEDRNPERKIMQLRHDNGTILQAVTSPQYGRIWDADVVRAAQDMVERTGGKFYNPKAYVNRPTKDASGFASIQKGEPEPSGLYASDRDVFMFLIDGGSMFDVGERAQMNRGVIIWNSEVGSRIFGLMTFLFNTVCGNHIIWGATEVNTLLIRHVASGPSRFIHEALPTLLEYTKLQPDVDAIKRAQNLRLESIKPRDFITGEDLKEWANCFARQHKFTRAEISDAFDYAHREEGKCDTLWDLVQGFTASARDIPHIDTRVDLESRAGKLIQLAS